MEAVLKIIQQLAKCQIKLPGHIGKTNILKAATILAQAKSEMFHSRNNMQCNVFKLK